MGVDGSRAVGHKSKPLRALGLESHEEGRKRGQVWNLTKDLMECPPRRRSEVCVHVLPTDSGGFGADQKEQLLKNGVW